MKLISEIYINKGEGKVGKCKYYRLSHFTETCCFRFYPNTYLTLSTVNEPSFIPRARWIPSTVTAAQRTGSSILHLAISA